MLVRGDRFGTYEILEPIGNGGAGEVFRAHDSRLRRDVAIKVLAGRFTADSQRLSRFEHEAHVLASLNHPNIATLHAIEPIGETQALVLELVEGETLAARIAGGRLPLEEALTIARQGNLGRQFVRRAMKNVGRVRLGRIRAVRGVRPSYPKAYSGGRWQISADGGRQPMWSHDGREIFYRDFEGGMRAASVTLEPAFKPGTVVRLFANAGYIGGGSSSSGRTYDVSQDGRRFLMIKTQSATAASSIVVVINWFDELKRAVPQ